MNSKIIEENKLSDEVSDVLNNILYTHSNGASNLKGYYQGNLIADLMEADKKARAKENKCPFEISSRVELDTGSNGTVVCDRNRGYPNNAHLVWVLLDCAGEPFLLPTHRLKVLVESLPDDT